MSEATNQPTITLYEIKTSVEKFAASCQRMSAVVEPKIQALQRGVHWLQNFIGVPTGKVESEPLVSAITDHKNHNKNIADSVTLTDIISTQHTIIKAASQSLVEFITINNKGTLRVHEKTIDFDGEKRLAVLRFFYDNRGAAYLGYNDAKIKQFMQENNWKAEDLRHNVRYINQRVAKELGDENFQLIQTKKASKLPNSPTMFRWTV